MENEEREYVQANETEFSMFSVDPVTIDLF